MVHKLVGHYETVDVETVTDALERLAAAACDNDGVVAACDLADNGYCVAVVGSDDEDDKVVASRV